MYKKGAGISMRNETFRKGLVCVVMVLFIGMGIMPIAGSLSMEKQTLKSNLGDDTTPSVTTISFDPPYADSDNGWYVSHWLGDVENEYAATTTITMNEDKTVQAFFVEEELLGYWSTTEVVSTESTDHSYVSSLMVDGDGTVHVAWHDHTDYGGSGTDSDIFYKYKPSGGSWTTTEVVSTESTGSSEQPSLMVDGDGTVHVAWMDETNYGGSSFDYDIFYKYKPSGSSWTTTEVVSTESTSYSWYPSLMVDGDGTVHVAWEDWTNYGGSGGDPDIFYKYKPNGGSWTTTEMVSTESTDHSGRPSLMVDGDGTVHVAWEDLTDYGGSSSERDIFYKYKPNGGSWTTTEVVSTESTSSSWSPSLMVDSDGTVHVAWDDGTEYGGSGSDDDIFYKYKLNGSSWITTEVVSTESTDNSWWPSLMVDVDDTVHVTWQDWTDYGGSGSDRDIFYKYKTLPFRANAHGPYYGKPGTPVSFTGSATGGTLPYSWLWDFGDGNTSDEQNPTHVYSTPGNYTVILTVTDDSGDSSDDTTWAYIENNPPNAPTITGPANGKAGTAYPYDFCTSDPDSDDVFYYIDWGDGETEETDFHASEEEVTVSHTWDEAGDYTIKAKAQDVHGAESSWGTFKVTMPRNKLAHNTLFLRFLQQFLNVFPILQQLLKL